MFTNKSFFYFVVDIFHPFCQYPMSESAILYFIFTFNKKININNFKTYKCAQKVVGLGMNRFRDMSYRI